MSGINSIDLKQLRYFVGVVDAGSLNRAARALYVAQPALTNRMTGLERYLGVQLLYRNPKGVLPTPEGEILYRSAKRILSEVRFVADELRSRNSATTGTARFACTHSSARMLTSALTSRILKELPQVRFSFTDGTSTDTYQRLQNAQADLAFTLIEGNVPGIIGEPLIMEDLFVVVSTQHYTLGAMEEISLDEVADLDFVMVSAVKNGPSQYLHSQFARASVRLNVVAEIRSLAGLIDMVVNNDVAAVLPWSGVHEFEERGLLRRLRVRDMYLARRLGLCRRSDQAPTMAIEAVSRITRELTASLIESGTWRYARLYS